MERLAYVLDTNVAADYVNGVSIVKQKIYAARRENHLLYLCQPVHFEVLRGLLRNNATRKMTLFKENFVPLLLWLPLVDDDWRQAAAFWADLRRAGKQLSDMDLLIAAITLRVGGVLVTADDDFDALPIQRQNWRL